MGFSTVFFKLLCNDLFRRKIHDFQIAFFTKVPTQGYTFVKKLVKIKKTFYYFFEGY